MIQETIQNIAFGGEGILRHDGFVVFVPFTAPGDRVTVEVTQKKKRHGFGKLVTIDQPSPLRTQPLCPFFGTCGGCQFQHLTYAAQLEIKRTFIEDALHRIGKISFPVPPVIPSPTQWNYRRHIRLHVREQRIGYIGTDGHTFVPIDQCPIFCESTEGVLKDVASLVKQLDPFEGHLKLFKQPDRQFLLLFTFSKKIPENFALKPSSRFSGILLQDREKTVAIGNTECRTEILGIEDDHENLRSPNSKDFRGRALTMEYSAFGFIQNHPEQSERLYETLVQGIEASAQKVLDLFCGIGTTSLLCAQRGCEVIGVESHEETVRIAKRNALRNGLETVNFISGKAEKITQEILRKMQPDCILCNPPRTGLDPLLTRMLIDAKPQQLSYVSCMPATLARDIRPWIDAGYAIDQLQGFDMFPQTTHVETYVKLTKQRSHQS